MSAPAPDTRRHGAASALTLVAGILGVTVLLAGELSPGYDQRYDTVSRLASPGQPWATVVRAAIVAAGVLVVVTATTLRELTGAFRRRVSLPIGIAGASTVIVGIAPKGPPDVDPTTISQLHVAASLIGVTALGAAMAHVTRSSPRRVERRRAAGALAVIAIAGTAFPFTWGTIAYGLLQRVILLTALAWLIATARHGPPSAPGGGGLRPPGGRYAPVATPLRAVRPRTHAEAGARDRRDATG